MTINPVNNISQMLLSAINNNVSAGTSSTTSTTTTNDSSQISPFAQLMTTLQNLQQSNPTQFKQVTATLASDLQAAATNAQNNGNSAEANALNQLASSFQQSSQNGQLPSFLQQGSQSGSTSGHHHHHHHGGGSDSSMQSDLNSISQTILSSLDPSSTSTGSSTTTS